MDIIKLEMLKDRVDCETLFKVEFLRIEEIFPSNDGLVEARIGHFYIPFQPCNFVMSK